MAVMLDSFRMHLYALFMLVLSMYRLPSSLPSGNGAFVDCIFPTDTQLPLTCSPPKMNLTLRVSGSFSIFDTMNVAEQHQIMDGYISVEKLDKRLETAIDQTVEEDKNKVASFVIPIFSTCRFSSALRMKRSYHGWCNRASNDHGEPPIPFFY